MNHYRKRMTLRMKINGLFLINILFVLILFIAAMSTIMIYREYDETGQNALTLAKTISGMPKIVDAFNEPNPSAIIEPIAENLRIKSGAQFIVVGNMNLIRYSHPDPSKIGKHMIGGDDGRVLQGKESITEAIGTLGKSIRGKYPIFDQNKRQIGIVSVGFLEENIWQKLYPLILQMLGIGTVALALGLLCSYWLSGHIKKQIFNLEPHEIAFLTQQQAAILESIREGIISIDTRGKITTCNREAKSILELESDEPTGKDISSVLPNSRLIDVLHDEGSSQFDQPMIIGNNLVVANRVPVMLNGEVIGAVVSFRDKLHLDKMSQRLADIGQYVDTLRSQRHEFMNKLHLISGLIQMEEYNLVRELIDKVHEEQKNVLDFYLALIRDPAIVGVIIGKIHRAKELGIQLTIDPSSHIEDVCSHRDIVITILGNAIENALEAINSANSKSHAPQISVYLNDETEQLLVSIKDTGPGIDPAIGEKIFQDGITTKGPGRGLGLALILQLVSKVNGKIYMESSSEGATLNVSLSK